MEEDMHPKQVAEEYRQIGDEAADMDIGGIDIEGIEKACTEVGKGYTPQEKVTFLKESILRARTSNQLGTVPRYHKETKWKFEESTKKSRRK